MTEVDELYMRRAIELAARGGSSVSPNPMVGAVIVKDGKIISEGWHRKYGMAHAERNAIDSLSDKSALKDSTMYVTLEPCCHYGKTPPCADYIVENGISKVFVGAMDPNPKVSGGGIKKLLDAGVNVYTGLLKEECEHVCRFFLTVQKLHRPYIMLKWAQSSDGFIGVRRKSPNGNLWFSGEASKIMVHKMRATYDAIMVGTSTVLEDNPSLTVRSVKGNNPIRITLDRTGKLSSDFAIFSPDTKTIVFSESKKDYGPNVDVVLIDFSDDVISQVLSELSKRRIQSLMVEGGKALLTSFIDSNNYDEINIFQSSKDSFEIFADIDYYEKVSAPLLNSYKKVCILKK